MQRSAPCIISICSPPNILLLPERYRGVQIESLDSGDPSLHIKRETFNSGSSGAMGQTEKKKLLGIWLSYKILIELKAFTILQCMPNKYLWVSLYSWTLCLYKVNTTYCDLCVVCMVITATQRLEMSLNGMCFTDHLFKQREKDQSKEHWYSGWIRPPGSLRINTINSLSLQNLLWSRVLIFMLLFWESEGHTHWETTLVTHNVS